MASHTFCTGPLRGTQLRTLQTNDRQKRLKNTITVAGSSKKLNTYDDKWSKVRLLQCCSCKLSPTLLQSLAGITISNNRSTRSLRKWRSHPSLCICTSIQSALLFCGCSYKCAHPCDLKPIYSAAASHLPSAGLLWIWLLHGRQGG